MERIKITLVLLLMAVVSYGQTARQVLEKTAGIVSARSGTQAMFTIKSERMNTSGTISLKGKKFHATTPQATIWFDGKTLWSYLQSNDEVNVTTPSDAELAAINPYNFIYMYKKGYNIDMKKKGGSYVVHLTATDKKSGIQEMYVTILQKTSVPSQVRMKRGKEWMTIDIRNFQKKSLADGLFRFNSKDFPQAEIIDLR